MAWSIQASGHALDANSERTLMAHLGNILGDPQYGVSASQFAGEHAAGTPGIPEPEPEPALPTLSLEAQNTALQEQLNELRALVAAREGEAQS